MAAERYDWTGGVTETLQWRTRVSRTRGETRPRIPTADHRPVVEVREALASAPLRTWTSQRWVDDGEVYDGIEERLVVYPPSVVEALIGTTDDAILIDRSWARGYEVGGYLMVVRADGTVHTRQIVHVTDAVGMPPYDWVMLDSAVERAVGDAIYAAFRARRDPVRGVQWHSPAVRVLGDTWTAVDPATIAPPAGDPDQGAVWWTPVAGGETYEVVPWRGVESSTQEVAEIRAVVPGGSWFARQPVAGATDRLERSRQVIGVTERAQLRAMLYRRLGRLVPAWVPAGERLPFVGLRTHNGETYAAFDADWYTSITRPETRAAVVLWCRDGSAVYASAQIWADDTHAVLPVPSDEVWIAGRLDPAPVSEVESVDWLLWARLDSDAVSIQYASPEVARVTLGWVTLPQVPYIGVPGPSPPPMQRFASVQVQVTAAASAAQIAEDYLDASMWAQAAMVIGKLRVELPSPDVQFDASMWAQGAMVVGRLRLEVPAPYVDPVTAILATEPTHFWWFGGLEYGGEETMRDDQGDPIEDGSTDVFAVRDLVTGWGSADAYDYNSGGGNRFTAYRLDLPASPDFGTDVLTGVPGASWVVVAKRNTSNLGTLSTLVDGPTPMVQSRQSGGVVTQSVAGTNDTRSGASLDETAYYYWQESSTWYALAIDGDDSSWTTTSSVTWDTWSAGVALDSILAVIIYDDGERVGRAARRGAC